MANIINLPQLGQTMEEGTIVNCLVNVGDEVKKGDVVFEVETDKATLEMECPAGGFVKAIIVKVGETIPVNEPVIVLGDKDEEVDLAALGLAGGTQEAAPAAPAASGDTTAGNSGNFEVVNLPQLGQTMEEGTIVNCLVSVGDKIKKGDVVFEVETDKATLEMECPAGGFVKAIIPNVGETIPVNEPVIIIGEEDAVVSDAFVASLKGGAAAAVAATQNAPAAAGSVEAPKSANVINLPQLGQTMEEGTIVNCLINEGEQVSKGDIVFEVETDKATLEMECPASGFVKKILVEVGQTIPVNEPVIVLGDKDEVFSEAYFASLTGGVVAESAAKTPAAPAPTPAPAAAPKAAPVKASAGGKVFASPRAKMVAAQLGIDIRTVANTSGKPRITEADVRKAAVTGAAGGIKQRVMDTMPAPAYNLGDSVPVSKMQKIVGQRMVESKLEKPCFYLNTTVDMTALVAYRGKLKAAGIKVSFNDFIIKAMGIAVRQFPLMAAQLAGDQLKIANNISVGLAISVGDELVAPLSKDPDVKSIEEVAAYNQELIARSKAGKLGPDDLSGGCITLSNLGGFGIESFIPIVVPGQCSILGVGKIADTPVVKDGGIFIRKTMAMTLSVDHKVANGAYAAQFLDYIKKLLEDTATFG